MKYICPKCDQEMIDLTFISRCKMCKISYYYHNDNPCMVFDQIQYFGSFEECCRVYKMKVFL